MNIEKKLPFESCDSCEEFILDVHDQVYFSQKHTQRIITVKCKNERICRKLKNNLKKMEDQ